MSVKNAYASLHYAHASDYTIPPTKAQYRDSLSIDKKPTLPSPALKVERICLQENVWCISKGKPERKVVKATYMR